MLLDVTQLSKEINISPSGIYTWVSFKKIPYIKIGRTIRFDSEEIKQWLEARKVQPDKRFN